MKVAVRGLEPKDMQSFADLCASRPELDRAQADRRAEIVEWVAFHNPYDDGDPTYFVGADGDRVLSHLGRMPTLFHIDSQEELACYFHDLYVHPELRQEGGQGFFLSMQMYRKCEKASKSFCAMIWTNEINISLQQARKYEQMWFDRRVLILGLGEKVDSKLPGPLAAPAKVGVRSLVSGLHWANGLRLGTHSKSTIEECGRFDERFDELWSRCAASMGICPRKDYRYLNWKYADRPHLDLHILQLLDQSGRLSGFCVVVDPDESKTAAIAEIQVVDNDAQGIQALLGAAISHARRAGAERMEAAATIEPYAHQFHERLFMRKQRIPLFMACTDRSPHRELLQSPRNWHVSMGDSEGPF